MTNILKKAIFVVMALVMSSSIVFGQNDDSYVSDNQSIHIWVYVNAIKPSLDVHYATITYRWGDENGWLDGWYPDSAPAGPSWINFGPFLCSLTNSAEPKMEYTIKSYTSGGQFIRSTCGIFYLSKSGENILNITSWNRCLGEPRLATDIPNTVL